MMETILETSSLIELEQLLKVKASPYWDTHYLFGKCSPPKQKDLGTQSIRAVIINSVIPWLITYGEITGHRRTIDTGTEMIQNLQAESNRIIKNWSTFGIKAYNAFESQALIHLYTNFCKQKRCLDCQIGANLTFNLVHEKQKS